MSQPENPGHPMNEWLKPSGPGRNAPFLQENIKEAQKYEWNEISVDELESEVLCMICWRVIDPSSPTEVEVYESDAGYVCSRCYDKYLRK